MSDEKEECEKKQHTKPCSACPFSRAITPGVIDPAACGYSPPEVYVGQAEGPFLLSCHKSPGYFDDPRSTKHLRCAGAMIYRANCGIGERFSDEVLTAMVAREPNTELVFASHAELIAHHRQVTIEQAEAFLRLFTPRILLLHQLTQAGCQVVPLEGT